MDRESLISEIIQLAAACQTGAASEDERARLERLLEDGVEARTIYLQIADDAVTLNDVRRAPPATSPTRPGDREADSPHGTGGRRGLRAMSLALAAGLALFAAWAWTTRAASLSGDVGPGSSRTSFARIVNLSDVQWADGTPPRREWQRLGPGESLEFDAGSVEVLYDNGAQFIVQGPARCRFISEGQILALSGKLVARVGPEATGFEIVTPHAKVVDRGTSFGLTIDPERQTDVVVYEGFVDLSLPENNARANRRLAAGEAIRVGRDGHVGRIASVVGDAFLTPPRILSAAASAGRVIESVTDNLKSSQTAKYYRIVAGGFREDCQAYVDRHHQWNGLDDGGIPPFLRGADYVMTFNDDKVHHDLRIAVTLAGPATLYVLVDDRATPPQWLKRSFVDTGWDVGIDEGYDDVEGVTTAIGPGRSIENVASLWSMNVSAPGAVVLGSLQQGETSTPPREVLRLMYGIVAAPPTAENPAIDN